jgi:hypothetical protein
MYNLREPRLAWSSFHLHTIEAPKLKPKSDFFGEASKEPGASQLRTDVPRGLCPRTPNEKSLSETSKASDDIVCEICISLEAEFKPGHRRCMDFNVEGFKFSFVSVHDHDFRGS